MLIKIGKVSYVQELPKMLIVGVDLIASITRESEVKIHKDKIVIADHKCKVEGFKYWKNEYKLDLVIYDKNICINIGNIIYLNI